MKRYDQASKQKLVEEIDNKRLQGISLRDACRECHTDSRTYKNFKSDLNMHGGIITESLPVINQSSIVSDQDRITDRVLVTLSNDDMNKLKNVAASRGLKYSTLARSLLHISIQQL